jgi:hypothetical protein
MALIWQLLGAPALAQSQPQSDLGAKNIPVLHALESNVPIFELTDRGLGAALGILADNWSDPESPI